MQIRIPPPVGPTIERFHASEAFLRIVIGPDGGGAAQGCVTEILRRVARQVPSPQTRRRRARWAVIYPGLDGLKNAIREWEEVVPPGAYPVKNGACRIEPPGVDVDLEVLFLTLGRDDRRKLAGLKLTGIWLPQVKELERGRAMLDDLTGVVGQFPPAADGGPTWSGIIADSLPAPDAHWLARLEIEAPARVEFFRQPSGRGPNAENLGSLPGGAAYYARLAENKSPAWIKVHIDAENGSPDEIEAAAPVEAIASDPLAAEAAYRRLIAEPDGRAAWRAAYDHKNPDVAGAQHHRAAALARIRAEPGVLPLLRRYYRDHAADFIDDWGCTFDPRAAELDRPSILPFILFPRQREWLDWVIAAWRHQRHGLTEKSRDMGASWLSIGLGATLCLFREGVSIGYGSRLEDLVDRIGDPDSLFWKGRFFLRQLPPEFIGGWDEKVDAPHMRIIIRETGSSMIGSAGDNIGRGGRASIFFLDEAAYLPRPRATDAALSQTTNCRQDLSSANGLGNSFAERRFSGKVEVFTLHWRDDPRKDQAWYDRQVDALDAVTVAQEIDIDYAASIGGVVIPNAWVRAAIDAHVKLGIEPTGAREGALDIADEGKDANAFCGAHGILVEYLEEWSGKGSNTFATVQRAFDICARHDYRKFRYDSDGLGALVRGDAKVIAELNDAATIEVEAYRGSEGVFNPEGEDVKGRKNKDYFQNRKAQAWWSLRARFEKTHRWIVEGIASDPDEIISISSKMPLHQRLCTELSQATYEPNTLGKIVINKAPDGAKSPNLADGVVMRYSPGGIWIYDAPIVMPIIHTVTRTFIG